MRKNRLLAMCGVFAAAALVATPGYADDYRCKGDVEDGYFDNVYVPSGKKCRLFDSYVKGNIYVGIGSKLRTVGTKVDGNIQSWQAAWVRIDKTYVGGNVKITWTDGKASRVRKSHVDGNVQVSRNYVPFDIEDNKVGGDVQFNFNEDDEFVISDNRIKGNLQCYGNVPKPELGAGGANKVYGNAEYQCYDLAGYIY